MRKGVLLIAIFVLMALLGLSWLVSSSSGLRTAVSLAERVVPGLAIEQAEGRLVGPLLIRNVSYDADSQDVIAVETINLDWRPSDLLTAKLTITGLDIDGVTLYSQSEQEPTESSTTLPEISLPFAIELIDLSLTDLKLMDTAGETSTIVDSLTTSAKAQRNQLNIEAINVETPDISAQVTGDISLTAAYPLAINYTVNLKKALAEPLTIQGQVNGDMDLLDIEQRTGAPLITEQNIELQDVLNDLHWSLNANAAEIDLAALVPEQTTRFEMLQLTASGNLTTLTAKLNSNVIKPGIPKLDVAFQADSQDLNHWQINATANHDESLVTLSGLLTSDNEPSFDITANWQSLSWPFAVEAPQFVSPQGALELKGSLSDYQVQLSTAVNWMQESLQLEARSHGSSTELTVDSLTLNGFNGVVEAEGKLNWETEPLQYKLNADWQDIVLPPSISGKVLALEKGQVRLEGNPDQLRLDSNAQLTIDGIAAGLQMEGEGETTTGFEQSTLLVSLADGSVNYSGPLRWTGEQLLDGTVTVDQLNPGVLVQGWPGNLSGQTAITVNQINSAIEVNASDVSIRGQLRERPLDLSGSISYTDAAIDIKQLTLQSGQSNLTANGQLQDDNLAFSWSLASPDLQDFYPDVRGSMTASGDLAGQMKQPAINASIEASALTYQEISVDNLQAKVQAQIQENSLISANVQLGKVTSPHLVAESLSLVIDGNQASHSISVELNSEPIQLALKAKGALSPEYMWQGTFQQFDFENAKAGLWQLTEQGAIQLSQQQQTLPRHCWSSIEGQFCVEAAQADGSWQTSGEFQQLPVSLFEGFAVELEQFTGTLRGQFDLAADKDAVIRGSGDVYIDNASLQLNQSALNQKKPLQLDNVSLSYQLDETQTSAKLHFEPVLSGVSAVDANVETASLQQVINHPEQTALRGHITTAVQDLAALELSHPAFDDLQGQLAVNLSLAGTIAQPEIDGEATLKQGQVTVVDAGIVLKEIEAEVLGNLNRVDFDLQARSGEGVLNGEGQFSLEQDNWELTTTLTGQQLEVMNTPEALVIAEPELTITITPALTLVKGNVHIPEAELEPTEFNSAVSPSRDVIVVSDTQVTESGAVTEVDVTVSLGDKVKLQAMGFQGRLQGDLRVFGKTSDILLANGEINIEDGTYLAYGQLLHVDNGSIRFAGGAVDNPELDIKAVRKGKDYRAGLHIQGFAAAPQANLFSDPDMSQDDVLSYLILGKPVAEASATDAALLASAATGMGLQNGAMIGDQIASTFGLDEFSIGGDSADNAALQVGKYLSPKLYLSYGIGVFESVSTVELRYELSKIWALKAESGTESGVDLLYTYERGKPESRQ